MAHPPAAALIPRVDDEALFRSWTRSSTVSAGRAKRARILLLTAEGVSNTEIAELVEVARQTVVSWRARYEAGGVDGLSDEARSGRPRTIDHARVVATTLKPPPKQLGVTHWSSRLMAARLGVSNSTVAGGGQDCGDRALDGDEDASQGWGCFDEKQRV